MPDDELEAWRQDWQALGGKDVLAAALAERAALESRRMLRAAILEVSAVSAVTALCLWLVVFTRGLPIVAVVTALACLFNGAWLMHYFSSRAGTFRAPATGLDAYVALTRARLASETRHNHIGKRLVVATAILVPAFLGWAFSSYSRVYLAMPRRSVAVVLVWAAATFAAFLVARRRERRLREEAERFERAVAEAQLD